jgi:ribosomal protein S18 acetylase RimI-like enzyme
MESLEQDGITVRNLQPEDLDVVVRLDAKVSGRQRDEYFRIKLEQNLAETGIKISLAAESEGCFCGFLLARVYYGEFGVVEPIAVLDTIAVDPGFQKRGVGTAMIKKLCELLFSLRVGRLQTEVSWDAPELLTFFHAQGFRPAERFCLDLEVGSAP